MGENCFLWLLSRLYIFGFGQFEYERLDMTQLPNRPTWYLKGKAYLAFFFFLVGVGFLVFIVLGVVWASWICGLLSDINSENFLLLLHTSILFLLCPFPIHIPFVIVPQSSRILCVLLLASQWGSFCWISSGSPALSSTSCTPGFISVAAALGVQPFLWLLPRRPLLLPSPSVHVCCVLFPLEPLDESV